MQLSPSQIHFIDADLKKRGVHLRSLREDLLDHICCLIEDQTSNCTDFKQVYRSTLKEFGPARMLQQQTQQSIAAAGKYAWLCKASDFTVTALYLLLAVFFAAGPVYLSAVHNSFTFVTFFSPFILAGVYICATRINYKTFGIIPFRAHLFPGSLVP